MLANFWQNGMAHGGKIELLENELVFKSSKLNNILTFKSIEETIKYNDILGVEIEAIIATLLRINLKDGTSRSFSINPSKRHVYKQQILDRVNKAEKL